MAERKTYTAEDLKGMKGRKVLVEGTLTTETVDSQDDVTVAFAYCSGRERHSIFLNASAIVEILPEEIGVGDKVKHDNGAVAEVRAIDGDAVLVRYRGPSDRGPAACWFLSDLTLVERAG